MEDNGGCTAGNKHRRGSWLNHDIPFIFECANLCAISGETSQDFFCSAIFCMPTCSPLLDFFFYDIMGQEERHGQHHFWIYMESTEKYCVMCNGTDGETCLEESATGHACRPGSLCLCIPPCLSLKNISEPHSAGKKICGEEILEEAFCLTTDEERIVKKNRKNENWRSKEEKRTKEWTVYQRTKERERRVERNVKETSYFSSPPNPC